MEKTQITFFEKVAISYDLAQIFNGIDMIEFFDHISLVPEEKAIGKVYRIFFEGNLEEDGYQDGFLYLPIGSGIKSHPHMETEEEYQLIEGEMVINGEKTDKNYCHLGASHQIDPVRERTIIKTHEVSKMDQKQYSRK